MDFPFIAIQYFFPIEIDNTKICPLATIIIIPQKVVGTQKIRFCHFDLIRDYFEIGISIGSAVKVKLIWWLGNLFIFFSEKLQFRGS